MKFQPAIKWSGSKRSQSELIIEHFPNEIETYYEPFCGGCSVAMQLMLSDKKVNKYVLSDLNDDLISLWKEIKTNPREVCKQYFTMWLEMNESDDKAVKREYFYKVRERFNKFKSPYDFMFIMRTTTNGMPRYNRSGEFNNSFHITRDGINPETFRKVIMFWYHKLNENNVEFISQSYEEIKSNANDIIYLDPPYAGTKGMYYGALEYNKMWDWMRCQDGMYYLSFDGISGEVDNTHAVPENLYSEHKYLLSGNSSFKRTIGNSTDSIVYESLYIK